MGSRPPRQPSGPRASVHPCLGRARSSRSFARLG